MVVIGTYMRVKRLYQTLFQRYWSVSELILEEMFPAGSIDLSEPYLRDNGAGRTLPQLSQR